MIKKLLFLLILLIGFGEFTHAQFYIVGQDPASVQWQQIKTPHFKIIYPEGYFNNANLYANTLELTRNTTLSPYLTNEKKPFTVVLHPKSTWANAMVLPAPLHGDFFEIPDQNLYPQIWQYQLALHETRHFAQMRKMYQGVGKALYYIFGQGGPTALFGIFIPMWFIEGDAVYNETICSKSGRGRFPNFSMDLKAQVVEKRIYKFDKAVLGSYRNYVPDHYTLGYQLVKYGVENYGYDIWNLALDRVARRPYLLKPFVNGLKTYSGLRKVKYYHKVLNNLQTEWIAKQKAEQFTGQEHINISRKPKSFTSYRYPVMLNDGSFIVERTGLDDINRFIRLNPDGTEEILFTPGFDYTESLSANDSLICWNEKQYDLRWANRDYSIIKVYNFKTKQLKTLTRKSKLFAPDLSPDATQIVATAVSEKGINSLQILDQNSGNILTRFSTEDNLYFMTPKWSDDGKTVVATVLGKQGKSILLFEPETGKHQFVLPFGFAEINRPFKKGNFIFYTGTYNGVNNLYKLNLKTKEIFRLTNVKYGVESSFATKEGDLIFSDYTADGYRVAILESDSIQPKKITSLKPFKYPVDKQVSKSTFVLENSTLPDTLYSEQKYSRAAHLFNPHTWGPLIFDVNTYETVPNLVVASQNMLATAVSTLGYYYNINEQTGKTKFTFKYSGWYPVIGLTADYGRRKQSYTDKFGNPQVARWHETNLAANISVPLRFIKSKWVSGLTPKVSIGQRFMKLDKNQNIEFTEDQFTFLSYSLFGYHNLKKNRRDMFSKWSQSIYAVYNHTPFATDPSSVGYLSGTFTFPGIMRHHGFKVFVGQQWKEKGSYPYGDYIPVPRGYNGLTIQDMTSLKVDYAFPIVYPDWDLQSAAYLTRIYAHLFFDYSQYTQLNFTGFSHIGSTGIELYTNWHFLSLPVEFTLGVRGYYKFNTSYDVEFLFGFGL
jgi:hypothetical protein